MSRTTFLRCVGAIVTLANIVMGAGRYYEVSYPAPATTRPGELQIGVTYTLWIPDGVARLRGIIVHQHGCGAPACRGGATAAYDLHWQMLAKKWNCALLGPSYHQRDDQPCSLWCDPRNGSDEAFLKAIDDFAARSQHPELERVPWCLWGHSGGGYWAGIMQVLHPDRIVGIWFRSGTASLGLSARNPLAIPDSVYDIPMMCNPGVKENGHKQFARVWTSSLATFKDYRAKGAPIGLAPDPRTSHECGDSRYLAIAFFDACLAMRLPDKDAADQMLKSVDMRQAWLATPLGDEAMPAAAYKGNSAEAVWLPNEAVAKKWVEYVKAGSVRDTTPPAAPVAAKAQRQADGSVEVTWDAEADFESGLQAFIIERDGQTIGRVPEKPVGPFGRPLFQTMSFHDTPEKPMPAMRFVDRTAKADAGHEYRIVAVNSVGLKSAPSAAAAVR